MPASHLDKISPFAQWLDQSAMRARTSVQCKGTKRNFFWPSEYILGSDKRIPAVSRDWKCCDTLRMFCLPESTYYQGLHGWAWPEKMQQFYLCQTATVQSDSEVWKQKKVDMKKWINHRKTRCAEDLKGFLKFWLLRFFFYHYNRTKVHLKKEKKNHKLKFY